MDERLTATSSIFQALIVEWNFAHDRLNRYRHFDRNRDEGAMQWRNLVSNGTDYTIAE